MITNLKIGDIGYPSDNSYTSMINGINVRILLAGTRYTLPKEVEVISTPYTKSFNCISQIITNEFIQVRYEGQDYEILNRFYSSKEEAIESINKAYM